MRKLKGRPGGGRLNLRAALITLLAMPLAMMATPAAAQGRLPSFEKSPLTIATAKAAYRFTVEIARTGRQHARGLMYRRRLAADTGMLFIYSQPQLVVMWMKNTLIPLDMLFIAADGHIQHIVERAVPRSRESISFGGSVAAVLELNGGTAGRLKIRVGDRISHPAFGTVK